MKKLLLFVSLILCTGIFAQKVETIAGPFNGSGGVKLGPGGAIYIADFGPSLSNATGRVVWRYTHQDSLKLFATGLLGASGNDFDASGYLIQSNIALDKISRISPQGIVNDFTNEGISNPVGVQVTDNGDTYICNCGDHSIRKIDKAGNSTAFASGRPLFCPNGITQDDDGILYVSNFSDGKVIAIDQSGNMSVLVELNGGNNGHLTFANGVLYVCSHGASQIFEVTLDGESRVLAGSGIRGNADGSSAQAQFSRPNGIAASQTGDTLYVNSSVPITDAGGRPLNPSLLRMITGVLGFTNSTKNSDKEDFDLVTYWNNDTHVMLKISSHLRGNANLTLFDEVGKVCGKANDQPLVTGENLISIPLATQVKGIFILNLEMKNTRRSFKLKL